MTPIAELIERNRMKENADLPRGLPCFCTANEQVLHAAMAYSAQHHVPLVIEATCNQVNQEGGYTGLSAADYAQWVFTLAKDYGVTKENIILGGDHLGPNPWRHLPAEAAMEKAAVLVQSYVEAGFKKIHLDASMACAGESTPSFELVAERAAHLCKIAENHAPKPEELFYIIGTEVPIPGGETDDMGALQITSKERLQDTIDTHKAAFERHGLNHVWPRIVSIVTQPGADFSHTSIHRFQPKEAEHLSKAILKSNGLTFEAHSTDYQPTAALHELVDNHFFFLKVGPELTFRMREAAFALAAIEELAQVDHPSNLIATLNEAMEENPANWASYYQGTDEEISQLKHFSYSDRIRYYWTVPKVKQSLTQLLTNIEKIAPSETIISQYFPRREFGQLAGNPNQLITDHISLCIERYYKACGY